MIIKLNKGKVSIKETAVPEALQSMFIQYVFEVNTNHLTPILYIGREKFTGDRIRVDMRKPTEAYIDGDEVKIKVVLVNSESTPVRTYVGMIPQYRYCIFGEDSKLPNYTKRIAKLEAKIYELENEGEVI